MNLHPATAAQDSYLIPHTSYLSVWYVRLLLAACLLFGSEILLWTNPPGRALAEWPLLIAGYSALATLLLDLMLRYRIHDLTGVMLLAGIYGLLAGLLLNPQTALVDLPHTLVTRVMGGHTLLGLETIGLFLALTGGNRRRARSLLLAGSGVVGLAWGIWVRWFSVLDVRPFGEVSLTTMFVYGIAGIVGIGLLLRLAASNAASLSPGVLRLSGRAFGALVVALLALLLVRLLQGAIALAALIAIPLLLALCLAILWFRRSDKKGTLLDTRIPLRPLRLLWLLAATAFFFLMGFLAYHLPFVEVANVNQLTLVILGFTAFGMGWLPLVSLVLGVRAAARLTRERRL
jgi:hypothetical protein